MDNQQSVDQTASDSDPRAAIIRAKEHLYSKVTISVKQLDIFILCCIVAVILLILVGQILK
ncbi:MAG: hypothetical protein LBL96_07535 [Clostridiales bacterium]|jgi:hypothetical protein|nr:hypothetical protein [Clostridiales bacterium]